MTPKEKATELREVFLMRQTGEQEQFISEHQALQCSIFHAENIIKELEKKIIRFMMKKELYLQKCWQLNL